MTTIYLTRKISSKLNKYLLEKIISIIKEKDNSKIDYFQIFEVNNNQLINSQEKPEKSEKYNLAYKFKEKIKIWAIKSEDYNVSRRILGGSMELLEKLKEKFADEDLEFRVGATNKDKTMGLALAYVQARAIQTRLDEVVGVDKWKVSYREVTGGFICTLSIFINGKWISKEDGSNMTEFESIKGGISSAFKRVASSGFGIGRYLYKSRNNWYPMKQQGNGYVFSVDPKLELKDLDNKNINKIENSEKIILTFGKYKGQTIENVYEKDTKYIDYLLDKSKDKNILDTCKRLKRERA